MASIQLLHQFNGYTPGFHDFGAVENARLVALGLARDWTVNSDGGQSFDDILTASEVASTRALVSGGGNVKKFRNVTDLFAGTGSAIAAAVSGAATSAANTAIGTSGQTPYGQRAWRLTTEALNGSYARMTVTQSSTAFIKNIAQINTSLPIILVIVPHAINGGSRVRVYLSGTDAAGAARVSSDIYISTIGVRASGEVPDPVIPIFLNMASFAPSSTAVPVDYLVSMQIEAYQEGAAGITDFTVLGVYQAEQRAQIHIGFDDGLYSVYENAFPIMAALDIVGSVSIMGDATYGATAGARTTYSNLPLMIRPEIDELIAAGWEVTVHGQTGISGTDYATVLARLQAQKAGVEAMGSEYSRSSMFYVLPGGTANFSLDTDSQPIGFKALKAAGFEHARMTAGVLGSGAWSDAVSGLGAAPLFQDSLAVNYLRAPATTMYETSDVAAKLLYFEQFVRQLVATGGMAEYFTHNVVPRAVVAGGQPYVAINPAWTGTASTSNDISIELFTEMMNIVARYRDLGLLDVVLKRDWWAGVPKTVAQRRQMSAFWTR